VGNVSRREALLRVRELIAGLDDALARGDLETARSLLHETAVAIGDTDLRRRTIPALAPPVWTETKAS
jgi:hypothetical protein